MSVSLCANALFLPVCVYIYIYACIIMCMYILACIPLFWTSRLLELVSDICIQFHVATGQLRSMTYYIIIGRFDIHLKNNNKKTTTKKQKQLWIYCPGQAGVKRNDRAAGLMGKATIASGLRLINLKYWGTWDTTCGHKAKDITPSITWRREAWKAEALVDLPWKDERSPSSVRWTL